VYWKCRTGKSCLFRQFIEKKNQNDSNHTIGVEFGSKVINVCGKYVKLQIRDTARQERFKSVKRSYYPGATGALLVYNISNAGEAGEKREHLHTVGGNAKWFSHCGKQFGDVSKNLIQDYHLI
uniref:Uncharacterized protein n=1 Tax=Theropithecus gelada TaxID=9565 RepID=A0A8D2EZD2_THEGE